MTRDHSIEMSVEFALGAHRTALWAKRMAKEFPHARHFYLPMAKRNRKEARNHIAWARKRLATQ